jgi:hypothetical protein
MKSLIKLIACTFRYRRQNASRVGIDLQESKEIANRLHAGSSRLWRTHRRRDSTGDHRNRKPDELAKRMIIGVDGAFVRGRPPEALLMT